MSAKKTPTPTPAIPKDKLLAIIKRLETGERGLLEESKALGFHDNGALRAALRAHLGGKKPYRALIEKGLEARVQKLVRNGKAAAPPKRAPRVKVRVEKAA
jgi:hypothetical protein